jgi:hypothetical protein
MLIRISFFSNLDRIAHKGYNPTEEDILRIRVKTCGVTESEVSIGKDRFRFIGKLNLLDRF